MVIGEDHVNQLSYQRRCKYFLCNRTRNEHLKQAANSNFAAVAFNIILIFGTNQSSHVLFNSGRVPPPFSLGTLKNDFAALIYK
jgi:hypothetical protein